MGIIRGGLFIIACVLFFITILAGNLFLTLSMSLEYKNVQEKFPPLIKSFAEEQFKLTETINQELPVVENYCKENSEYVFNKHGHTFVVPCEIILQGPDIIVDNEIKNLVQENYYKNYNCNFWDCFRETEIPFFLISEKAKNYWNEKFYFALISAIILIALMFILIDKKTNLPFVIGFLLILASLPFIKLNAFDSFFTSFLGEILANLLSLVFSSSYNVFLVGLLAGIIFLGAGLILKFFKIGFKISKIFHREKKISKKDVKEIVKEEVLKTKSQQEDKTKSKKKEKNR